MTANKRMLALVVCGVLVLGVTAPAVVQSQSTPTPEQNRAIEDGRIVGCGEISENGRYEVSRQFDHDGSEVCLNVTASSVTIHDGILGGDRDTSTAIQANGPNDGEIRINDVTFRYWGERVLNSERGGQKFTVSKSEFVRNTHIYEGTEGGGLEMEHSRVSNTHGTAISGQRMGEIRIHDTTFTGGGGAAIGTIDGASIRITSSEFTSHDGTPLGFDHSTSAEVHNTDITNNEGNGISVAGGERPAWLVVKDSTIRENDGNGVNAVPLGSENSQVTIEDTEIDDNGEKAINAYVDDQNGNAEVISARNVDLGGGLVVSFENQKLDLGTEAARDHETDALNYTGPADGDISTHFATGGDESKLWAQTSNGWQERDSYDSGAFTEVVGPGVWAATAGAQQTDTPEPTDTPQDTDTSEHTESTTQKPDSDDSSSTPTERTPGETGVTRTPARVTVSQSTPTDVSTPDSENPETDDSVTERTQSDTERDEDDDSTVQNTEGDDGVSMDGPGFGTLPALIAVLGISLLIRRRS